MLIWPILVTFGPDIEGRLFPVVVSTELTKITEEDETHSMIYGTSRKIRKCSFYKMEWYYGSPRGENVLVPLEVMERSRIRDNGEFTFGPWMLNLDKELARKESFAIVYHRCHPFWMTKTHFWP